MRAVIQRVSNAQVTVEDNVVGSIQKGLLILLGITDTDDEKDINYLCDKIVNLRIFEDDNSKMNLSLKDINGELLIVSQFTLFGDCRKGRRPNFTEAANPAYANKLYKKFLTKCGEYDLKLQSGSFGEHMDVKLSNDGPVTILIDSKKTF